MHNQVAGCSKRLSSKAAGESKPEAYPRGYVEDFDEPRTTLGDFFNVLLIRVGDAASSDKLQKLLPGLRLTAEGA